MNFAGGLLLTCFYSFMTALFAALIMVPFLRQWALDKDSVDQPDARKVHDVPMPRLGGIAICLAFLFSAIIFLPIDERIRGLLAGMLIIFATGVVDDLNGMTSRRKFAGQVAACLTTILVGKLYLTDLGNLFGFGPVVMPPWFGILFTIFAVVGVINAINLIDGLDGLAGGVSSIALTAFFLISWLENDPVTMILSAALVGAIFGFLKYNFYPARIFMGDTGSMVVGYVLAFIAVASTQRSGSSISPMAPVLILGLPLLDTVWVMMRRIFKRISPFTADRTHIHHQFLELGFEHRFTVVVIYTISLFWAVCALVLRSLPEYLLLFFYLTTALCSYLLLRYLAQRKEQFNFLRRDDSTGIRSSTTYQMLSGYSDYLLTGVKLLLSLYLVVALLAVFLDPIIPWQIAVILLGCGVYLWQSRQADNRQFLMLVAYATFGLIATQTWSMDQPIIADISLKRCGDIMLGAAGVLAVIKILFRRIGELFLTTADYLVLAVCIFLAIASQQAVLGFNINGPLFRTVVGIVALRTTASHDQAVQRAVICCCVLVLLVVSVMGLMT
jgi:UDP-GlcNAc:undecaprenyl-phosphate GlcNAc-1-phosphate transferase